MLIRALAPGDAPAFQALRLQGLRECPTAFASSWEEEQCEPLEKVAARLASGMPFGVYGAIDEAGRLLGVAGLAREGMRKLAHKAVLWGMYVAPTARRHGVARQLVAHVLGQAAAVAGLRQVTLCVHSTNHAALALYESLGFTAWGTEPGAVWVEGEPHAETWMVCMLPGQALPRPPMAVMIPSADPAAARAWYARLWPQARAVHLDDPVPFDGLMLGHALLEFVPADAKLATGAAGTVVYWPVADFDAERAHAESLGARLYRGPLAIENGRRMAQFTDPFGNLFGLRG
jgi:L-amino acid N-acyltransferase YncA/catechol 2,3-dioxygenase-like lactoylglutathione lyase family enzyme